MAMRKKIRPSAIRVLPLLGTLTAGDLRAEIQIHASSGDPAPSAKRIFYFSRQNNSHHRPASFLTSVRQDFGERGMQFTTSTDRNDLNLDYLNQYDGTFFFGNHDAFTFDQTSALESYLQSGGGMVGMHVIAYVARSNAKLARILGGAFRGHHSIAPFTARLILGPESFPENLENHPNFPFTDGETYATDPGHPVLAGLEPYTSPDEPYLHQNLNPDITLLSYREDHGGWDEPYTWVRNEGDGRVFYHANGHDSRTWSKTNFRELMIRGTAWSSREPQSEYHSLLPPIITPSGQMQFLAMVQTNEGIFTALHSGNEQTAMSGFQIPGEDESLKYLVTPTTSHTLLENGQVVLTPKVQSASGETSALLFGHQRYPRLVAIENGPADSLEAGFTYSADQTFPFVTNSQETVIFAARIEDSAGGNQKRVLARSIDQTTTPILMEGDPLGPDQDSIVTSIPEKPMFCATTTRLAVIAELQSGDSAPRFHVLTGDPENLQSKISTSQSLEALPAGSTIADFIAPVSLQNEQLIFSGRLAGPSVDDSNDQFLASVSPTGEIDMIIREGDLVDGVGISLTLDQHSLIVRTGDIVISGVLGQDHALVSLRNGREPKLLARENQSLVANGQQYLIKEMDSHSLAAGENQAVMLAVIEDTASGVESQTLLQIGSGTIRPLISAGDQIEQPSNPLVVSQIQFHQSGPHGSGMSNNEVRLVVSSATNESAIVGIPNIDDLDGDGLSDTLEVAFGNSITGANQSVPPGYPRVIRDDDGRLQLSFWNPVAPGPGLEFRIEASDDMLNWTTISPEISESSDQNNVAEDYRRMLAAIDGNDTHRFFRFAF